MAPNKTLAAQLANEFRELLPEQRRRVLRLLLRLLPARGLRPADGHLHREGLLGQRRGRAAAALGDQQPAHPARRRRGRHRLLHLRPGHAAGVRRAGAARSRWGSRATATSCCARWSPSSTPATTSRSPAARSGCGATRSRSSRCTRSSPCRIEMFGDEVERLYYLHPLTGEVVREVEELFVFPATHYVAGPERMERAIRGIEAELEQRLAELERQGKLLEAQRLRMRTTYDIEMMRQVGFCSGIENYSRHIDGRAPGHAPAAACIDYFPDDFLLVIDESHVTVPQIGGMYEGDMSRKRTLVEHGFRLPSAMDNRPLKWEEFTDRIGQTVYLSATPGPLRAGPHRRRVRRAGHPADRAGRPRGRGQADQGPDRRPGARDPAAHREGRAGAGHHADQEDVRGPHRLPARARHQGPLPALRGRHPAPRRAAARAAAGRVRRAGRHQPAARGPRPARGVAGGDPRRGQGGLPAVGHLADPDHRPRGAQRLRPGAHVRRQDHPVDGAGDRGDQPAPREADRLQHRARRRPAAAAQEDRRHPRRHLPRGGGHRESTELLGGSGRQQSRGKSPVPGLSSKKAGREGARRARSTSRACRATSWPT